MIISKWTARLAVLAICVSVVVVVYCSGIGYKLVSRLEEPKQQYIIHNNTLVWLNGQWHSTCSVMLPTWESYEQFLSDFHGRLEPPCHVVLMPLEPKPVP